MAANGEQRTCAACGAPGTIKIVRVTEDVFWVCEEHEGWVPPVNTGVVPIAQEVQEPPSPLDWQAGHTALLRHDDPSRNSYCRIAQVTHDQTAQPTMVVIVHYAREHVVRLHRGRYFCASLPGYELTAVGPSPEQMVKRPRPSPPTENK